MRLPLLCLALCAASLAHAQPFAFCRFVPERDDDFAFENDRIAFRVYGPAGKNADSGIDVWVKSVDYPILDKWYKADAQEKKSYHVDHGEGYDAYKVGLSRGCGGLAIWQEGKPVTSGVFKSYKVLDGGPQIARFELTYEFTLNGEQITETRIVTLPPGSQLARVDSLFTRNGQPLDLSIGIGLNTGQGPGQLSMEKKEGYMALWEKIDHKGIGTGVVVDPALVVGSQEKGEAKMGDSWLIVRTNGKLTYFFGASWEGSGRFPSAQSWESYLETAAADYSTNREYLKKP